MQISFDNITQFLDQKNINEAEVFNEVFEILYPKIKQLANIQLNRLKPDESLSPTQLVHECYLKLNDVDSLSVQNRNHFYSLSARCMRFYLVDLVRQANSQKNRGHHTELKLTQIVTDEDINIQLLELDMLLTQLAEIDQELAVITELKFFGGFTFDEIAEIQDAPKSTIFKKWLMAKSFMVNLLEENKQQA
ncbi:ECF-type sigma factor [Marinicella sp. W31]|uniref:ECF-type sigma factor n=1 Tax=Marinicella sp. W31 TaxID=3023713 RepID=UPI00375718AE